MGQTLGRAPLPLGCKRFLNLPRKCVYELWEAFNDIAEGFGLTIEEFQEIVKSALMEYLSITERQINSDTESVFRLFDDDENNLVDSLEFLSAFALLSGMTPEEKIRFIFAMYDFDESGVLSLDEMVLAFRSSLSGLTKISKIDPPTETDIENIVVLGFDSIRKAGGAVDPALGEYKGIDREDFVLYCLNTPEVLSWIEFFDDLEEYETALSSRRPLFQVPAAHTDRSLLDEAGMNPTHGGLTLLECERKGDNPVRRNWQNVLPFLAPIRKQEQKNCLPHKNVKLEWVYGINAHSGRQALYYSAKGEAVYAAGAVCVVQNINQHQQRYFVEHTDLVTCLKLYHTAEGATIVASGECGVRPAVHVWDCDTTTLLVTLQGVHRNGILQLDFSPDREKLVTLGMDPYHSIAVYAWRSKVRIWSARTTNKMVHDVRFLGNDTIATCGEEHVYFWRESKPPGVYKRYRGQFGTAVKPETLWCIGMVGSTVFSGSETGMIYVWEGRNLVSSIKGHTGAVYACHVVEQGGEKGLVTACSAGKVLLWNSKLELGASFNAGSLGAVESSINSVCYDLLAAKILICFGTCEAFEMDATDGRNIHNGGSVIAGHYHPRVCGLAAHPTQSRFFCSVGDDKTVRIFDAVLRRQLRVSLLDTKGHCVSYSQDGLRLIVGLGSGVPGQEERKEGAFVVLSEEDLTLLHEARDSKCLIADIKCAPNGESFALASHDGSVYVYGTKKYVAQSKCRGHSGQVEHVDFSSNSQFLMSNCSGGDLLFWDAVTGELQMSKTVKTTQWETNSCTMSYATQGLWGVHDSDTQLTCALKSNAQDVVAVVDNFGKMRLANFPCIDQGTCAIQCFGHAKSIENCQISCDDAHIFTSGGTDGSVFQWRMTTVEAQKLEDLKKDASIATSIATELLFEGKMLEKSTNFENVINSRPVALSELEEGSVDVSPMMAWQKTIVAPSRVPVEDNAEPSDVLDLEYVYGFSMDLSRECLMYAPNGSIVFFAAGVAVVMNQKLRTQRFYNEHNATITAMAVSRVDGVVATGDQGEVPVIRIWLCETLETVTVLQGFHRRAINHLKFSGDGKHLVTVGQDANHSVAVYDWRNKQIMANAVSFDSKSLFIDFNPNGSGLIHCGNEVIRFWDVDGRNMHFQDAMLGSRAKVQGFLCAGWIGSSAVVGTADGNLYRFLGHKLDSIVQAHDGAINSIAYTSDGLCSAAGDGFIKIWTRFLECRLVVETKRLMTVSPVVRCVDWDYDVGRIILGTASAEIFEIGAGDGENLHKGALLEGHGGDELWGLAVNPAKDEFCTVGDDSFLRVWNVFTHASEITVALEMPARCCAFSPDGKRLAVGLGCPKKLTNRQFDGKWIVLDTEDYQVSHEARDSTKWVTDIKYSPNGELIAMGSYDNKIYVYSVSAGYALNAVIGQHQSFITSLDFSEDSAWLQSNCGGFELCYFEADTGLFIPAASRLRDTVWATQNCTMTWAVQGIWPPQRDGTECTASECNLFRGEDGAVVACGDNYGRIRLFRYPCTSSLAVSKLYWASSNPVTRLRFLCGDSTLISLHGADKVVMQWAHRRDRDVGVAFDVLERKGKVEEEEDDVMTLFGLAGAQDAVTEMVDLNHLVSTRPWIASIVAPSSAAELVAESNKSLASGLEMSHILGLQSDLTRQSVRFNNEGDVLYPASKYVCVYNKKTNSQRYYTGHAAEVSCVAVSQDGLLVASAERTARPCIHIWDSSTCVCVATLPYLHRKGVVSMQFSANRKYLVSLGQDEDHSVALWASPSGDWTDGSHFASSKGDVHPALFCSFYEESAGSGGFLLATGGRFHQKFWKLSGRCINAHFAEYDNKIKIGTLLCGIKVGNKFVSGSTSGHLYLWKGRKLDRSIRAHELAVTCLWSSVLGLFSAAKDGVVKFWSLDFEHIRSFSLMEADVPPVLSGVRSLDARLNASSDMVNVVLVTTAGGEIYEIAVKSGSICLVHEAHYTGQLWGLCMHPSDPDVFVTTGDDKTIRVWSISARRLLRKAVIDCSARSVGWSPDGKTLIVGLGGMDGGKRQRKDGAYLLLDAQTLKPLYEGRDSRHWISAAKFSPDGKSFAVASMDHKIYIYNSDTFRLRGTCDRHNSHVCEFDYSTDSMYLQSDSSDYEHLYFEAEDGEYFSAGSQLKDIKWSDWTCIFGWPVQGVWPYFNDIESGAACEPSAVHRSPGQDLLVVGDKQGCVKLMRYPCVSKEYVSFKQSSAHVKELSKVRFSCDGRHVISVGKSDRCIVIWKVLPLDPSYQLSKNSVV